MSSRQFRSRWSLHYVNGLQKSAGRRSSSEDDMAKPWRFLPYDAGRVKDLCVRLAVSPVLAQVLSARGYEDEHPARTFLNSKLNELHDPELLPGVAAAADRI